MPTVLATQKATEPGFREQPIFCSLNPLSIFSNNSDNSNIGKGSSNDSNNSISNKIQIEITITKLIMIIIIIIIIVTVISPQRPRSQERSNDDSFLPSSVAFARCGAAALEHAATPQPPNVEAL